MLDDEFVADESEESDESDENALDFHTRRSDIQYIDLDAENTTTLIPYLDIVNEVLARQIVSSDYTEEELMALTAEELEKAVSPILEEESYPFNMPFSLDNEKIKNYLHHLGISARELHRLFATDTDDITYTTVAREYLGLSVVEWDAPGKRRIG